MHDFELFQEKGWTNKFNEIKSKYGIYGVLGNHEYISDKENEFIKEMQASSGTWGPPARIGTDSEIVVVNLKFNKR